MHIYTEREIRNMMVDIKQTIKIAGKVYRLGPADDRYYIHHYIKDSAQLYHKWWKLLQKVV